MWCVTCVVEYDFILLVLDYQDLVYLKLVRIHLNYATLLCNVFFLSIGIVYAPFLRMNVLLDFIYVGSVELR